VVLYRNNWLNADLRHGSKGNFANFNMATSPSHLGKWLLCWMFHIQLIRYTIKVFLKISLGLVCSSSGYGRVMDRRMMRIESKQLNWTEIRGESHWNYHEVTWIRYWSCKQGLLFLTRTLHFLEDMSYKSAQCFRINLCTNISPHCDSC
jgi:hypothetical protein